MKHIVHVAERGGADGQESGVTCCTANDLMNN